MTTQTAVEAAVAPFKDQALQVLTSIITTAAQVGDFIKGQIPLVVQELLAYNTAKYCVLIILFLALSIGCIFIGKWGITLDKKDKYSDWSPLIMFSFLFSAISLIPMIFNIMNLLQITLAPRVWLIEYATSLVK